MGQPMVRVASAKPATSGPVPSTACANVGTYVVRPSSTAPTRVAMTALATSTRRENTHRGSTGSAARRCTTRKIATSIAPLPSTARLGADVQAHAWPPSSRPRISSVAPAVSVMLPR